MVALASSPARALGWGQRRAAVLDTPCQTGDGRPVGNDVGEVAGERRHPAALWQKPQSENLVNQRALSPRHSPDHARALWPLVSLWCQTPR